MYMHIKALAAFGELGFRNDRLVVNRVDGRDHVEDLPLCAMDIAALHALQ